METTSAFSERCYQKQKPQEKSLTQEKILFKGHDSPFSNFYPLQGFYVNGINFATTEAAYVYQKAMFLNDRKTAEVVKRSHTGIHAK